MLLVEVSAGSPEFNAAPSEEINEDFGAVAVAVGSGAYNSAGLPMLGHISH